MDRARYRLDRELIPHLMVRNNGTNRRFVTLDLDVYLLDLCLSMSPHQTFQQLKYPSLGRQFEHLPRHLSLRFWKMTRTLLLYTASQRTLVRLLTYNPYHLYPCLRRQCNLKHQHQSIRRKNGGKRRKSPRQYRRSIALICHFLNNILISQRSRSSLDSFSSSVGQTVQTHRLTHSLLRQYTHSLSHSLSQRYIHAWTQKSSGKRLPLNFCW